METTDNQKFGQEKAQNWGTLFWLAHPAAWDQIIEPKIIPKARREVQKYGGKTFCKVNVHFIGLNIFDHFLGQETLSGLL